MLTYQEDDECFLLRYGVYHTGLGVSGAAVYSKDGDVGDVWSLYRIPTIGVK